MAMNQSCYGLRGKNELGPFFTYYATRNLVSMLRQQTHGSVFDTIIRDTFRSVKVVVPPVPIVEAFERLVEPYSRHILHNLFESRTLAALRDALLPRLISGELRVKDAEWFIGRCAWSPSAA